MPYLRAVLEEGTIEEEVCEFDLQEADGEANPLGCSVLHGIAHIVANLKLN